MRGSRVQAVVGELQGEKIDIIPWTESIPDLVVSALQPADVAKVVLDEQAERIEVVVPDEQLSLAIGRRGQNVRLASQLIGWDIDILTEQEESERRQKEFSERSALFMQALDVDEMVAQLLASEGFSSIEELAYIEVSEIASIQGFDEETAGEIQQRARRLSRCHHPRAGRRAQESRRRRRPLRDPRPHRFHAGRPRQGGHQVGRGFRRLCRRRSRRPGPNAKDGDVKRFDGTFKDFPVSREEAEDMIMQARLKAGWVTEADLAGPAEVPVEGAPA